MGKCKKMATLDYHRIMGDKITGIGKCDKGRMLLTQHVFSLFKGIRCVLQQDGFLIKDLVKVDDLPKPH